MKTRFTSVDIKAIVAEIVQSDAIGLRVVNVYDVDNKTYLIRVAHGDIKKVILIESGNRVHLTDYDWPKNMMPSGFSMKCRKHLKGRRLAGIKQLGVDRIIDFIFGYDEAAYHLIVELYDRGNVVLTDYEYNILQLLRVRTDKDKDVKYAVREIYPIELARQEEPLISRENLRETLQNSKHGEPLKKVLNPMFVCGPAVLESCMLLVELEPAMKLFHQFNPSDEEDLNKLMKAIEYAEQILTEAGSNNRRGYIIQKRNVTNVASTLPTEELLTYNEFHPFLFQQSQDSPHIEFDSFNKCVDEFFSKLESQKIDMKTLQMEKAVLKRLDNVREDHEKRVTSLKDIQDDDMVKAGLIEMNLQEVEQAIATINSAIANQIDWEEIQEIVNEAKDQQDSVANLIKSLNLKGNQIVMSLSDPYSNTVQGAEENEDRDEMKKKKGKRNYGNMSTDVLIDLNLTAFANARNYHNKRRHAAQKEQKTLKASEKALKSAEQKTQETLKEMQTSKMISKTRKTNWFEKFYWFISSENYLVIGGRDQQQNELIVKRYLKPGDLYVHADLHGASSVILKNPSGKEVPPKTLNDAGTMAICYSAAWDARVVTSAWWVYHNQVSKTAPSGEYLTTGSFMIRGKKNYLPPSYLIMGFSVVFKLDESSVVNHLNDRKMKTIDDAASVVTENDNEIALDDIEISQPSDNVLPDEDICNSDDNSDDYLENNVDTDEDEETANANHNNECTNESDKCNVSPNEEETAFPDTNIELKHVSGGAFQLYRGISALNQNDGDQKDDFVYLGDDQKVSMKRLEPEIRKPRLSAKQKRELKKKNKPSLQDITVETAPPTIEKITESVEIMKVEQPEQPQLKRRQRNKQKKIKDKYKDQDDEDRELMQQLLRSNEPAKPPKKKGKQKQGERPHGTTKQQNTKIKLNVQPDILYQPDDGQPLSEDIQTEHMDDDEDEEIENENISILDSLTGCPREDDALLYAVPFCAPYSSLQNFKYKVKLTPGTGRRGKAAKLALQMFQTTNNITDWEKDLLRCLKDVDISRNIPGKVKLSAPYLQKAKKK